MKKILLTLLLALPILSFCQDTVTTSQNRLLYKNLRIDRPDLPAFLIANESDTIGIVFTIENVQKIDRNLEVLEFMEKQQDQIDSVQYYAVSLVSDLEQKIDLQKTKIINLISQSLIKDGIIKDLRSQISERDSINTRNNKIIENNSTIIAKKDKEIKKQKFLKWVFIISEGVAIVSTVVLFALMGK